MECNHARLLLNFAQPLALELEESEAEALANHLATCPACAALDRGLSQLDQQIGRAMRDVPLPVDLKERLTARLTQERRRFYLRSGLAVAAALLLALGGGWMLWPRAVVVDLDAVQQQAMNLPTERSKVEQWFADRGVPMRAPGGLDYALLCHCTLADFHGKRVPLLEFRSGHESAWVYVLDARQFDLKALESQPGQVGSGTGLIVEWRPEPADERFAYLFICTGAGLEPFKKTSPAT
jgi:hypothetical protein